MSIQASSDPSTPRQLADAYVLDLAELNPLLSTALGMRPHEDRVPDLSPAGHAAEVERAERALAALDELDGGDLDELERRCATLLRDRLGVVLEGYQAGDHLREIRNIFGPAQAVRSSFHLMPTRTDEDWAAIGRRMARVPEAY